MAGMEQEPALMNHCGRCLEAFRADDAIAVWNGLVDRKLIEGERVEPEKAKSLVNANFAREFSGTGFDWAAPRIDGVALEQLSNGFGMRVVFSRNEPESCVILAQYAALAPDRNYR